MDWNKTALTSLLTLGLLASAGAARAAECMPCPAYSCAPAVPVTHKVKVIEYVARPYETTVTVNETRYKNETYTYYTCETAAEERTQAVTRYRHVPETRNVEVTRYECVPVEETRDVTRYVWSCVPVQQMVSRCVDQGGHYECREVPCGDQHGCGRGCGGCGGCGATRTVSCYVPNIQTVQVPVTVMQRVCNPVTEKVKFVSYRSVPKKETVPVTTYRTESYTENVKYTVPVTRQVPHQGTRQVAYCEPVQKKVTLTRMEPVEVEREVTCYQGGGDSCGGCDSCGGNDSCGGCGGHHRHGGRFHRCR